MSNMNLIIGIVKVAVIAGVVADHWYGIQEAGNISIAAIWLIITLTILSLFIPKEETGNNTETALSKNIQRVLMAIIVLTLFSAGWFFSAVGLLVTWILNWLKHIDTPAEKSDARF